MFKIEKSTSFDTGSVYKDSIADWPDEARRHNFRCVLPDTGMINGEGCPGATMGVICVAFWRALALAVTTGVGEVSSMKTAQEILHTIGEHVAASANVRNVYGEPVSAHDRTLIPVARIGYGFGAGGRESGSGEGSASAPAGGGGGGGTGAIPVGVVEISAAGTRSSSSSTLRHAGV